MLSQRFSHRFDLTPKEAIALQQRLRRHVVASDAFGALRSIAGVDVGFTSGGSRTRAAVVVLSYPALQPVAKAVAAVATTFPYVPGLLSFREIPAVLAALDKLRRQPDLLLCDGQGYAHPRRFGLACHLGVLLDRPCIGVAKSRLIGEHDEVDRVRGAWKPLLDGGETIGAVLRTRTGVKPLYVSVGHRVSLVSAIDIVLHCATRYRLPEPSRLADRLASQRMASKSRLT
jgi:deoxyribonuclease V